MWSLMKRNVRENGGGSVRPHARDMNSMDLCIEILIMRTQDVDEISN